MLLHVCAFALLSYSLPVVAPTGAIQGQEDNSPALVAIFEMAQREMPLPVLKVTRWPAGEGQQQILIQLNTAGQTWAKRDVMNVLFAAKAESLKEVEVALHSASTITKNYIESSKEALSKNAAGVETIRK